MDKFASSTLEEEIGEYWDERAESYSNGVRGELSDNRRDAWQCALERALLGQILEAALEDRAPRAIDLGCGPGFFSILLAEMGCRVDAVDASHEMLERARSNALAMGVGDRITFHQADVTMLGFDDGAFDIVVNRNLMWLMRNPEAAYIEWLRILRPGGKLMVFDANWYLYLVDDDINARRHADQDGRCVEEWGEDARATTAEERRCERIAAELPLTPVVRPGWDLDVLSRLGAKHVSADEGAWLDLWTESEKRFYATSPMFMVEAVAGAA
ncbi:MAG: class I SAM-dependent methyltransferase [Eggerthellaceae bacterium]|nr:class I SAM-dependent methyltransferase [Eggerthellaceae bacterium]